MRGHNSIGWDDLEKEFRTVILAEAGAGKTFEMEARARKMQNSGKAAFFIRVEDIERGFESAFEVGDEEGFQRWLKSQDQAWFFLDSVDEARVKSARFFEKAIRLFAQQIKPARQRAHIIISSRPYAWRSRSDSALVDNLLPFAKLKLEKANEGPTGSNEGATDVYEGRIEEGTEDTEDTEESSLCVYSLNPLTEKDIRSFASVYMVLNIDRLISELQRANLMSLAENPLDLGWIFDKWKSDQALDGRLELLQNGVVRCLQEAGNPSRTQDQLSYDKALDGARLLSAAVILTGKFGINVSDVTSAKEGIDAQDVLGDWQPSEIQALLACGLFNDALYGVVRFRHREIRELLAAEWFSEKLKNGRSRFDVESLFFREQYGQEVITPRLRPVLPWLLLFDDEIRRRAEKIVPEVVVEGGDTGRLPLVVRKRLIKNIVERIANDEDNRSARDNSAIARVAQGDLTDDVINLIKIHQSNDDVIFFLGRLVWLGEMSECVPLFSPIALDSTRGIYARIASVRTVVTCGSPNQIKALWGKLIPLQGDFPRRILAEILSEVEPCVESVSLLLKSIDKVKSPELFDSSGLKEAFHTFIDRMRFENSSDGVSPLMQLVNGLNGFLEQEPYLKCKECDVSKKFGWLLKPATHAVERLVHFHSADALKPEALGIMLKVAVEKWDQNISLGEYKEHLHKSVPLWGELNDALFWRTVESARTRIQQDENERLFEVRSVQWIEHYWRFDSCRFHDVLNFISQRNLVDDKLVALSLAHLLFVQSGKDPDLLNDLRIATQGNAVLKRKLADLLNPVVPPKILELQRENEEWSRRQEEEKAEGIKNRAEWIERLKANPDAISSPPDLKPNEITHNQYWLFDEVRKGVSGTHRAVGANWKRLCGEFGDEVAQAYRDAAVDRWRKITPGLRSIGDDTTTIPWSYYFALTGLEIEARERANFPMCLSKKEVCHALRYIVWEMNGFPSWLEKMYNVYPDFVLDAVTKELIWELENTEFDNPQHYILHDLVYYAPWLHSSLSKFILNWMTNNEIANQGDLEHCIAIVTSGETVPKEFFTLVRSKILAGGPVKQLALWYALWVDVDAAKAIPKLKDWLAHQENAADASLAAQLFIIRLVGRHHRDGVVAKYGSFRSENYLKDLYLIMHKYIRVEDDIDHTDQGVYTPTLRDEAQGARYGLLAELSQIRGEKAYVALSELATNHSLLSSRPWIAKLAYKHAEEDADIEPWTASQVRDFEKFQMIKPKTHRQLFDVTVAKLKDLQNYLERGSDSPYKTWQRVEAETEMRTLVAGWLKDHSSSHYSCAQENEFSNGQRPDIWVQAPRVAEVPIELKLLEKWTGPQLCERLCNQLAGDYLREEAAGCGVMLLIWRGRVSRSHWKIGDKQVPLADLKKELKAYWDVNAKNFPNVEAIEIVVIDLTVRGKKSNLGEPELATP
ncbi:hypothetical protein LWC08_03865 [Desulfobaculum bizertense]|uniref:hypothetical protein n=1 Tax=Desulfobaculum bizertense TaxID=376490 RepID=UPI001F1A66D2|nr:hypothetical protein [Desulfobaculum bizertense]UIJ38715.1 hypothetical protein LWC08_03865 [Desulfobaculum bizertense]